MQKLLNIGGALAGALTTVVPPIYCTSGVTSYVITGAGALIIAYFARRYGKAE